MPALRPDPRPALLRCLALCAGLALLAGGCAGTARGVDHSVYGRSAPGPADTVQAPGSTALVVIRYPAMIHADAESLFISSYAVNAIGGVVPYTMFGNPQTGRMAQSLIAKSSYYAMSLYRVLSQRLPEHTVLLSPHIIVWDQEHQLHSRPILASEQVPSVLTVDFNIYSFPDVHEMMDAPPVTFGDLVTPLVVVRGHRWGRPAVRGLLLSSEPLLSTAWRQSGAQAERLLAARQEGRLPVAVPSLEFISFLAERDQPALDLPTRRAGNGRDGRMVIEQYPVEKIQMDGSLVAGLNSEGAPDPFAREFVSGISTRLVDLLGELDHGRATFFARQAAVARFDPQLATVFFTRPADERFRARLQLAQALVRAEREFLSAQSESIFAGTYTGDFGIKMRKIVAAEYRMLEERRRLARKQNMTTAVAALALAGSVGAATVTTTASAATVATLSGVSLLGSVWAINRALDTHSESEQVNETFIARMAPTFERQMSVQMEWLESKELITARGFAEFRNKTLSLYQSRVRSMSAGTVARCAFRHPEFGLEGAWYGACEQGVASGQGYGVIAVPGGASVEYLGAAVDGRAAGTGAMIRTGAGAPVYYEGSFAAGLPHGVVRVESAGAEPRLRRYAAGRDVGRGSASEMRSVRFAQPEAGTPGAAP